MICSCGEGEADAVKAVVSGGTESCQLADECVIGCDGVAILIRCPHPRVRACLSHDLAGLVTPAHATQEAEVTVQSGATPPGPVRPPLGPGIEYRDGTLTRVRVGDEVLTTYADGRCTVHTRGPRLDCWLDPDVPDLELRCQNLVYEIAYNLLPAHGLLPLHAACWVTDAHCVLVTAGSDGGKTTQCLSVAAGHEGWVLADDMVLLKERTTGPPQVVPWPRALRVHEDALRQFPRLTIAAIETDYWGRARFCIPLSALGARPRRVGPTHVWRLALLRLTNQGNTVVHAVPPSQAAATIFAANVRVFRHRCWPPALVSKAFAGIDGGPRLGSGTCARRIRTVHRGLLRDHQRVQPALQDVLRRRGAGEVGSSGSR
jgi:hypothetical protein